MIEIFENAILESHNLRQSMTISIYD